ncbi:GntR family transcriptional regulator [Gemmobacter aquaticus]|uniref:GntR family transcriptional regulator n=1 Tax=Gemmobacter aquaticus TaxID=490185 RepID=A0A917YGC4_9RHOB|nr:GntR family transcriptional regulator [Gemmobacter aquaticus]GGO24213.1 GntR family transcriptional regulator [Gemmobacter aquaticus]
MEGPNVSTSKTAETYNAIKSDLLNGRYKPGEQLRIDGICSSFDVSKGAVREALARLTSDGLVENTPQKGFVVAPVSAQDLINLTEVRVELECRCLELSIAAGDLDWEGRVLSAYHLLSNTDVVGPDGKVNPLWTQRHDAFHDGLISACQNAWRLKLRNLTYLQAERYRRMMGPHLLGKRDIDAEHAAIMYAALARNAPLAVELMSQHLQATLKFVLGAGTLASDG